MNWISWLLIIWVAGYLINRITFWIGAFLWSWSELVIFHHRFWYTKNTTIRNIIINIKYKYPEEVNSYYPLYNDFYECANFIKWVPGINLIGASYGILMIIGFIGTVIGIIVFYILYLLWKYFLSYIWKLFKYLYNNINNSHILNVYNNIINKILNLRIS